MKLTTEDKKYLKTNGYLDKDMAQIEDAIGKTIYEINDIRVSASEACEILGREKFLSGIGRSAFHWSAARDTGDGATVYFDSRRLFA